MALAKSKLSIKARKAAQKKLAGLVLPLVKLKLSTRSADPSKSLLIRKRFEADITRRFKALRSAAKKQILAMGGFDAKLFQSKAQRVKDFTVWLDDEIERQLPTDTDNHPEALLLLLLIGGNRLSRDWLTPYVVQAYAKGVSSAFNLVAKRRKQQANLDESKRLLTSLLKTSDTLALIQAKTKVQFEKVLDELRAQITREALLAASQGKTPAEIAAIVADRINKIAITRSKILARSETIYSVAEGQLDAFEALGVTDIGLFVESQTTSGHPCPICIAKEGIRYPIQEARGLIPWHPNCLCIWVPSD